MKYHQMREYLSQHGFEYYRDGAGTHEQWHHPNGSRLTISRSGLTHAAKRRWQGDVRRGAEGRSRFPTFAEAAW
jgi:predicted RNA binding protein YcfA (HicA-like mRNA interferase family)